MGLLSSAPADAGLRQSANHANGPLPTGIFATPSCGDALAVWVLAAGHEIYQEADADPYLFGGKIEVVSRAHGWFEFANGFVKWQWNGGLDYIFGNEDRPTTDTKEAWAAYLPADISELPPGWGLTQYELCDALPHSFQVLHGEAVPFLLQLDRAIETCRKGHDGCRRAMMATVDITDDGFVSEGELARLGRVGLYLINTQRNNPPMVEVMQAARSNISVATTWAGQVMVSLDTDANGQLSERELDGILSWVIMEEQNSHGTTGRLTDELKLWMDAFATAPQR